LTDKTFFLILHKADPAWLAAKYCLFIQPQLMVKDVTQNPASDQPPKLLDQLRRCIRDKHYGLRTERVYGYWARWYIRFHGLRHLMEMGAPEIQTFLSYLANERNVSVISVRS
jgi:hypothetical protein